MKLFGAVVTILVLGGAMIVAQQGNPAAGTATETIRQARQYFFQVREGNFGAAPKVVALVEAAVKAHPEDAALASTLVTAYQMQGVAAGNAAESARAGQLAFNASERALQLDSDNADALAAHGGMLAIIALQQQRPFIAQKGIGEVFRAVEIAPSAVQPRLYRAAVALGQRADIRVTSALIDDLKFLGVAGAGSRSGDMEHLLLADLYAEIGRRDDARGEYQAAARRPASAIKDLVASRLVLLDQGGVPASEIARIRGDLGNCIMCHAK